MTLRKPNTLRTLGATEAPQADENFERLYQAKLESRHVRDGISASAAVLHSYQAAEHGVAYFSANASAITTRTFPLAERYGTIVFAIAHAQHASMSAHVTDVTSSEVTIACGPLQFTTAGGVRDLFSSVTTAAVTVYWEVVGAN